MAVSSQFNLLLGNSFDADDLARHGLGQSAEGDQYGEYVYVKFAGTTVLGDVLWLDKDFTATLFSNTAPGTVGNMLAVAKGAAVANQFGWVQRRGQAAIRAVGAGAANAALKSSVTAGAVAVGAPGAGEDTVGGMVFQAAPSGAGTFEGVLNYPSITAVS